VLTLVGKHIDSTVNNPIECWAMQHGAKANRVRPLAVFDTARIHRRLSGERTLPTIKEACWAVDVNYLMLRGIFGAPGMPKDAVDWYVAFLRKVTETPEWKKYPGRRGPQACLCHRRRVREVGPRRTSSSTRS